MRQQIDGHGLAHGVLVAVAVAVTVAVAVGGGLVKVAEGGTGVLVGVALGGIGVAVAVGGGRVKVAEGGTGVCVAVGLRVAVTLGATVGVRVVVADGASVGVRVGGTNWVVVASRVALGVAGLGVSEALALAVAEGWPVTVASRVAVAPLMGGATDSAMKPAQ
jgi:hypothetical protein